MARNLKEFVQGGYLRDILEKAGTEPELVDKIVIRCSR